MCMYVYVCMCIHIYIKFIKISLLPRLQSQTSNVFLNKRYYHQLATLLQAMPKFYNLTMRK